MTVTENPPQTDLAGYGLDESTEPAPGEALSRPYRLGIVGFAIALGLFARLGAANGFGSINSRTLILAAAATSLLLGLGLATMAAERDRFGPALMWIAAVTALSWGALNWISPPFGELVTVWSNPDQAALALLGVGNGMLLAGLISLALVRRGPTLTVAATLLAGVMVLAANTVLLRKEWPAIVALGLAFTLILLAWDRSPRREQKFVQPEDSPRVSRAALSFISVALCGTAIQLWLSRTDIPRSLPVVALCALLIIAAFGSMIRVRREIERRETTLSEWRSWMREIRTNNFRSEIETFDSGPTPVVTFDPRPPVGADGEAPRALSFPNLVVTDTIEPDAEPAQAPTMDPLVEVPALPDATHEVPVLDLHISDLDIPDLDSVDLEIAATPAPALDLVDVDLPDIELPSIDLPGTEVPSIVLPSVDLPAARITTPAEPVIGQVDSPSIELPKIELPSVDLPTAHPIDARPGLAPELAVADAPQALPRIDMAPNVPAKPASTALPDPAPTAPPVVATGTFSSMLGMQAPIEHVQVADLQALEQWLHSPVASARTHSLLVAVEAMSLDEFESLPPEDAEMARDEIGRYLADTMPDADLVSWIDGPYFIVAHASKQVRELQKLNKAVQATLKSTDGIHAFLRPGRDTTISEIVDEAVIGIVQARQQQALVK